jgi:C2 domain
MSPINPSEQPSNTEANDNRLAPRPQLKLTIAQVRDKDNDVEGNGADFFAKVWFGDSLAGDTSVFDNNNNNIFPNWEFTGSYPLSHFPDTIPIRIQIFDQDTVFDDQVDINPNRGETLNLFLDTHLRRITGDGISGFRNTEEWITIGEDDTGDDAEITFKIVWS